MTSRTERERLLQPAGRGRPFLNLLAAVAFSVIALVVQFGLTRRSIASLTWKYPTYLSLDAAGFALFPLLSFVLIAYGIYQARRPRRESPLLRRTGWWTLAAMAVLMSWMLALEADRLPLALALLLGAGIALAVVVVRTEQHPVVLSSAERWLVAGPFEMLAGWTLIALATNATQALSSVGFHPDGRDAEVLAVVLLAVGTAVASTLAFLLKNGVPFALGAMWALVAIAIHQLAGEGAARSAAIGVVAVVAASIVGVVPLIARLPSMKPALVRPIRSTARLRVSSA
ncbi:MAG: hypothetical protein HOW73_49790 [Polyangiaceae bacterium]|nr:hypothetical protein [Polyangiaceae bacterium]